MVIPTKSIYKTIKLKVTPTAVKRWEYQGLTPPSWTKAFKIPYSCTRSTKLQSFQYQVIHRFIPTRKYLHLRNIVQSPVCLHCDRIDTLVHFLFSCRTTRSFWEDVSAFFNYRVRLSSGLVFDARNVIFGACEASPIVNLVILMGKYYVYTSKMKEQRPRFEGFKMCLRNMHDAEKVAARQCAERTDAFHAKWDQLHEYLDA